MNRGGGGPLGASFDDPLPVGPVDTDGLADSFSKSACVVEEWPSAEEAKVAVELPEVDSSSVVEPNGGVAHRRGKSAERGRPQGGTGNVRPLGPAGEAALAGRAKRTRSASRRRKIQTEVRFKELRSKDVFALQERLLTRGASQELMEAAQKLLQVKDYDAVVTERGLECVCGFPPCTADAVGAAECKKWKVDTQELKVYDARELANFCSLACFRESGRFKVRMVPDPTHFRPTSAVAASRGAVAASKFQEEEAARVVEAANRSGEGAHAPGSPAVGSRAIPDSKVAKGHVASSSEKAEGKLIPGVRKSAVVRFSREAKTYSVHYDQYGDGGGEIQGLNSASVVSASSPQSVKATDSASTDTPVPIKAPGRAAAGRALLQATVVERNVLEAPGMSVHGVLQKVDSIGSDASTVSAAGNSPDRGDDKAGSVSDLQDDSSGDELGEIDMAKADGTVIRESFRPSDAFVLLWGTLSSWMTDAAREVLQGAVLARDEDERPDHLTRRKTLLDILSSRISGDMTGLAPRLSNLVVAIGVHQPLLPVSEGQMYDLLAALIFRAILRSELAHGTWEAFSSDETSQVLEKRILTSAAALGVSSEQLEILQSCLQ